MANMSESLIQEILDLKKKPEKTASASASKIDVLSDTLIKLAEEMDKEEESKDEGKDKDKGEKKKNQEEEKSSDAESIVEAALAEIEKSASNKNNPGEESVSIDYTKLAQEIVKLTEKTAVDGTGVYGLDADMTANPKADAGTVSDKAKEDAAKRTHKDYVEDRDMGVKGPVDPMKGYSPQAEGGEDTPLTPGEIKTAMAKMSDEDITAFFKLAQVGYDVTVDVISDEIVEKQAMAKVIEKAERVKAAQAYNYLKSVGIDPLR